VRYDLLVIDEMGYLTLKSEQSNAFFKLMGERYSRKTTIITTNLSTEKWYELFASKNPGRCAARPTQTPCITISINGSSLRNPPGTPKAGSANIVTAPCKMKCLD